MEKTVNLANDLLQKLSVDQTNAIKFVCEAAQFINADIYLVGGAVRDLIMGKIINDIDISIETDPVFLTNNILNNPDTELISKSAFNTMTIRIGTILVDIAMTRTEKYATPAILPEITYTNKIQYDLKRRDFTVNAMAISLNEKNWGDVIDLFGGIEDINHAKLNVLHEKSFTEDPTRIFRAIKYMHRLDLVLTNECRQLLISHIPTISKLSGRRISNEFRKIFDEELCSNILNDEYFKYIYELLNLNLHADFDSKSRSLILKKFDKTNCLLWGLFFHHFTKETRNKAMLLFGLGNSVVSYVDALGQCEEAFLYKSRLSLYKHLNKIPLEIIELSQELLPTNQLYPINFYIDELSKIKLLVNGNDVIKSVIAEGPRVGQILDELLLHMLEKGQMDYPEQIGYLKNQS